MLTPDFARLDVEHAAAPGDLARGRELAGQVEDLDRDEFSVWGSLPGERIPVTVPSPAILCNCSRQLPAGRA
jgi:hypothetical protein